MKKSLERIYAEWFVKHMGWDECEIHDSERPDFIIDLQDKKIGLEITNLYKDEGKKGSPQKTKESLNIRWLQKLASEYYKQYSIPIRVQVLMSGSQSLPDPSDLVDEIVKVLPNSDLELSELEIPILHGIKIKLYVRRLPEKFNQYKRWTFVNNHVGWVREINNESVKSKIENKRTKATYYKKNLNELLLLIIIDSSTESGMLNLPCENFDFSCKEFNSIYLVKHLLEIKKIG
jgi:hypothetical protein